MLAIITSQQKTLFLFQFKRWMSTKYQKNVGVYLGSPDH